MDILVNRVVSRLIDTLINLTNEELHLILGVPEEIQKLRETLCSIQDVLYDAEQRQITQKAVKRWLSRLTDVMYDADDILDEYRIVAEERASQEHPPKKTSLGRRILPRFARFHQVKFTHEIGVRIQDLNKRLEEISATRSTLDLRVSNRRREVTRVGRQTSPEVEPDIVGNEIERHTRDLVDLLTKEEKNANANVVVLAIVGAGGIGKTTLAQNVFHKIKAVFQKTIWVCVSQEFVETDLLRQIITSAGGSPGDACCNAQLESKAKDVLKDSKFLLVLDDVWDAQIWEDLLRKPLQIGAVGSRVLVTTRNQRVAHRMKAIHIHNVNPLSLDDSWLLLCKKVTKNAEEERDVQSLKDIGMKLVEKCQGLPLAITVIGGVLCGEFKRWKWREVERSSAWSRTGLPDGVHQALYLSYEDLPSHLKQCFLHCSLFRGDCVLKREYLVWLWVAEGFVVKVEGAGYQSLEEIAQGYYDELIQRSLLQTVSVYRFARYKCCNMHDLLRSLCQFLARGESLVITNIKDKELPTADDTIKLRRLSILAPNSHDIKPLLRSIQCNKSVRTLFLSTPDIVREIITLDDKDVEDCFNNFQRLRVVDLGGTTIQSLPKSIGNLLHLRYLNLSYSKVKELPESIASLKYLQFLILEKCSNLRTLPKGLVKLCNLRTLNLSYVPFEELPSGIAGLENLNVLKGAMFCSISKDNSNNSTCSLEEISQLCKLRELSISKLGKTIDTKSSPNANGLNKPLMALEDLVALDLSCCPMQSYTDEDTERIETIVDVALHPPSCVRHITINFFFGRQFPRWLMSSNISSFLSNLTDLALIGCRSCSLLPPLGKLSNLEELQLLRLDAVTSIGAEFFGYEEASTSVGHESGGSKSASSSLALFPRLKRLHLEELSNLEAWHWVPEGGGIVAMPQLNVLEVANCPKLLSLPEGLHHHAIRLTELSFRCNTKINSISRFPTLKNLNIELTEEQSHSLPDWLVQGLPYLTSLQRLQVQVMCINEKLVYRCLPNGLDWPKINHIPDVQISDFCGNFIAYNKHSSTFQTNVNFMATRAKQSSGAHQVP